MGNVTVTATYRGLLPPWLALGGPIPLQAQRRSFELGERSSAEITVDAADIDPLWIRAGSCWSIESTLYDEIWVGFVDAEDWPLNAGEVDIPLVGIIDGLLQIEAGTFLSYTNAGQVLREGLIAGQARRSTGLFVGDIEDGPLLDSFIGGETVADLIDEVQDLSGLFARERVEVAEDGLRLLLDFGILEFPKTTVLTRDEITDGLYKRSRVPTSVSVFGPSSGFSSRPVSSVSISGNPTLSGGTGGVGQEGGRRIQPVAEDIAFQINKQDIGPGAGVHAGFIEDRASDIDGLAQRRLLQAFRGSHELMVTLDMTKTPVQNLRIGDMIKVHVSNWAQGFGELDLDKVHIHAIEPHEEDGTMDVVMWPHPHG